MTKKGGKRGIQAAIANAQPIASSTPPAPSTPPAAAGGVPAFLARAFDMRGDGLWRKAVEENKGDLWLCGPFAIEAETRDGEGNNWGLLMSWTDRDGRLHEEVFPRSMLAGDCAELRGRLNDGGLPLNGTPAARQALVQYLNVCGTPTRAHSVMRIGWHVIAGRRIFTLPDRTFGQPGQRVVLQGVDRELSPFGSAGTLAEWRSEVSRLCNGNSRLLFATSCAFGAPLLGLLGEDGGGFNILTKSQYGKTTVLRTAASACGGTPEKGAAGYVRSWRATSNGLEGVAVAYSDCLLPLDEIGQSDAREAGEVAYMLANGQGKARGGRTGGTRAMASWRVLFLSTGEIGLADKNAEAGRTTKAGQEVRLVDMPGDAGAGLGLFEYLHDEPNGAAFVKELQRVTATRYGTALPAFLEYLAQEIEKDASAFVDGLRERIGALLHKWLVAIPKAGGQVQSVARRFALVAVGGELASAATITEWPAGAAAAAAETCFRAWLGERGTVGAAEDAQAMRQLRAFVLKHGSSRFDRWVDPLSDEERLARSAAGEQLSDDGALPPPERFRTQNRAGWSRWRLTSDGKHRWGYYLTAEGMAEAMAGLRPRESTRTLADAGLIIPPAGGYEGARRNLAGLHTVPGSGKVRLYEIDPLILAIDDDAD